MREILPVLDVDDTFLMGSTPTYRFCYQKGFEKVGLYYDDYQIHRKTELLWGASDIQQFRYNLNDEKKVKIAHDEYMRYLRSVFVESVKMLPGTVEALGRLSVRPALVTGIHPEILKEILSKYDMTPAFFDPIISSYEIDLIDVKPSPFGVYKVLEKRRDRHGRRYPTQDTVVVGDSINDMLMANAAGTMSIAVLTGKMTSETIVDDWMQKGGIPKIDYVVKDITCLPEKIEEISHKS
jgi:phosphoglycolate phosphatase-like HAD superfamily hydrolase